MVATGVFTTVMLILATPGGVALTVDSAPAMLSTPTGKQPIDAVAILGSRVVVAGSGYVHLDAKAADGSLVATYDFNALVSQLKPKLPRNPRPSAVAEAVRAALADTVAHVGDTSAAGHLPDIVVLVGGLDGKQPTVWTVTAHLESHVRPVVVEKQRNFPDKAGQYVGAYGMKRSADRVTAEWRASAPDRLKRESPPLSFDELTEVAGLMVQTEPHSKAPFRQWVIAPGEKIRTKLWEEPR